ncbi:fungal transcriptional regulatory protein [Grosmannia clavigera kw1407]|uniref:Fungal transcriptional regulatory protein n=1 Tax=Grosmannia clavigera (strain kw1407 / UAMH 11150) TaxID=655863 RepID=F0XDH8_GROCL|nr:fungal transcriptional regulatory protein [Grosmannia clavigera kw1407]EFX04401.1 fungal transcriptional regulatory protein [Grosmannia clavigera kw1407]
MATEVQTMTTVKRADNPSKARKRAPKACLSCRARKVRCDVSQRGRPCMNCYLDSESCVVTGRASRLRKAQKPIANIFTPALPSPTASAAANSGTNDAQTSCLPPDFVSAGELHTEAAQSPGQETSLEQHGHLHMCEADESQHDEHHHNHAQNTSHTSSKTSAPGNSESHSPENGSVRCRSPSKGGAHSHDSKGESAYENVHRSEPHKNSKHHHNQPQEQSDQGPVNKTTGADISGSGAAAAGVGAGPDQQHASTGAESMLWASQHSICNRGPGMTADITYSYYPFLAISNLSGVLPQDVNYLETQSCLRVPTRAILDEFQGAGRVSSHGMSLLVFQAMLFSTCNFISRESIHALGFPTIRVARAAFYRRAKLLFDFETETSPAAVAQAALLLSFWSPSSSPGTKTPNTAWLCTAIQHAKLAEAHRYASLTAPRDAGRANALKRLWWCCVLRDRILGLGLRRSIHITRAHFDFDANPPLNCADLADEIERSPVYNPGTKSCLNEILVHMVKLCVVLTDILALVFPLDGTPGWGRLTAESDASRVRQCKAELRRWYKDAMLHFPMFGGATNGRAGGNTTRLAAGAGMGREFCHDSIILYTNLMYMYYHSTRVALCHHEVLHVAVANANNPGGIHDNPMAVPPLYESRRELKGATSGVTECLKELIRLRLARWLPISAVTCTALPLFLHIIDVKLSSAASAAATAAAPASATKSAAAKSASAASSALKQHRLNILIEAMKTYQPQYDGVDWISETIRHVVNMAEIGGLAQNDKIGQTQQATSSKGADVSDWTDILASNPSWYLRLALTMDMALSKNRIPEERDFPVGLRSLFSGGFGANANAPIGSDSGVGKGPTSTADASMLDAGHRVNLHSDISGLSYPTAAATAAPDLYTKTSSMMNAGMEGRTMVAGEANGMTGNSISNGDNLGDDYSSEFLMSPHHLAMSMGVAMGMDLDMDLDMDLIEMDMDMGFSALSAPSVATQLQSSDEEMSPPVSSTTESIDTAPTSEGVSAKGAGVDIPTREEEGAGIEDEHDWIEQAWDADGGEMRESDRDTAKALLEAMSSA